MNEKTTDVFVRIAGSPQVTGPLRAAATAARQRAATAAGAGDGQAMTHSWLFTGPPGSGRSVAARCFAAALVCTDPSTVGCGRCRGCTTALAGNHADVITVVPVELVISVKRMREIIREASGKPAVANWRVIIIEDADRLSDSAANALLKTVEEPPERTVIILCAPSTDPLDIAVTLRSRCRHIYVPTPSVDDVARVLCERTGADQGHARLAAAASACHIGRARHLLESVEARRRREAVLNLAGSITRGSEAFLEVTRLITTIATEADDSLKDKEEAETAKLRLALGSDATGKGTAKALRGSAGEFKALEERQKKRRKRFQSDCIDMALTDLAGLFRDSLMQATGATVEPMNPDKTDLSGMLARNNSPRALVECIDAITICRQMVATNTPPAVALDAMLGRMRLAMNIR
ncbi:DNA polymerase III subunit delta' [Corynebacterium mendelii]|uniref:DNA polymerase III subunit delta' n=1 Tax=Corynebacterium mendelii TaxID=2765362 RepID=UPI002ED44668